MSSRHSALLALIALAVSSSATATPLPRLTPDGWGKLRIGMRERDAVRLFHMKVPRNDGVSSFECREDVLPGRPSVWVMARNGRISRISTNDKALKTDKGFGVGSRELDIERAYGAALIIEPHTYDDPPAHYVTSWTVKGKRGVRYETGQDRRVGEVHVGDDAIEYVEGCL